jgi:ferrochelatase
MKAVVLLNMGGPRNLDEVEVFLKNMFLDKYILPAPLFIRKFLSWYITKKRKEEAKNNYKLLGGKSPIVKYTENLIKKMNKFQDTYQIMRYTPPFAKEVVPKLTKYDEIIAIPLYPHYSQTTTKSSVEDLMDEAKKYNLENKIKVVEPYFDNEKYNKLIIKKIRESLKEDNAEEFELIFSAHGLPKKIIEKGDVYQKHIEKNVEILKEMLKKENLNFKNIHLAYQSRLGPVEWIRPYLDDKLKEIGKKVIIYPIAFTIDNSETEFELDIEYRKIAKSLGIEDYRVAKCLNDDDEFVEFLQSLI